MIGQWSRKRCGEYLRQALEEPDQGERRRLPCLLEQPDADGETADLAAQRRHRFGDEQQIEGDEPGAGRRRFCGRLRRHAKALG
jgi:hypothetical protein